ncbi:MAG: 50S ribosomal protein L31 [Parcubacteria group bacterium]
MKKDTHPQYNTDTKVKCVCGKSWTTGSTMPEIEIEICSNCHPFYTGKDKKLDTRGRIERFTKRQEKSKSKSAPKKSPSAKPAKKSTKTTIKKKAK